MLLGSITLREREPAPLGGLISCERLEIAGMRALVTLVGGMQTRSRALVTPGAGAPPVAFSGLVLGWG